MARSYKEDLLISREQKVSGARCRMHKAQHLHGTIPIGKERRGCHRNGTRPRLS
eukprot:COSAG01_NODE_65479_length_273_cov_0.597701_1_plen_53_part_10